MRILFILCFCVWGIFADTLEVSAKKFTSDMQKGITELNGEVLVARGEDRLWADQVIIETNKKRQPQKYTAIGNVRFYAKLPDKKVKGQAKKAIYDVQKDEYQFIDTASIEEVGKKNLITGNLIILNIKTQEASVKGSGQRPGVITFTMDSVKSSNSSTQEKP